MAIRMISQRSFFSDKESGVSVVPMKIFIPLIPRLELVTD